MAHREVGQMSLADALVSGVGASAALERLSALIEWKAIGDKLAALHSSRYGRKAYPPMVMLKALLLAQWHGLSDPALETALADRLSFRRFCGLALDDATPDHVTISRFRAALQVEGLAEAIFAEVTRQIDERGLILRRGTLIDASLVEAAVARPKPPKTPAPAGADGRAPSKLVRSPHDPDAAWAKKGGRRYFGYKAHVGVDQGSGIIRRQRLTPANVNDTVEAEALICGDEQAVYADQGYDKKARRKALRKRGVKDRLMHRPNKHHPLTPRQERRNALIGRRRAPVEQVFAKLKRGYGWVRVRYRGLARNAVHLALMCTAMNLRRLVVLMAAAPPRPIVT
jgi:IS5 family transposase